MTQVREVDLVGRAAEAFQPTLGEGAVRASRIGSAVSRS